MKKHATRILLGLLLLLAFLAHVGKYQEIPVLSHQDAFLYDVRIRMTMPGGIDERIVIVDLDEKSLGEVGRWPWGRDRMSDLVRILFDKYGITVLGFDVVFAEPDDSSGLKVLESLGQQQLRGDSGFQNSLRDLRRSLDYDQRFADTLKGKPVVLGYYFSNQGNAAAAGALPPPVMPAGTFQGRNQRVNGYASYSANLPVFQKAAANAGHFNPAVDVDGISRRVALIVEHKGQYFEALSLAMVRQLHGNPALLPGFVENAGKDYGGLEWLDLTTAQGPLRIPVDVEATTLIPYRGKEGSFRYISAVDVLKERVAPEALKGKIVIVGTTTPGLLDLRATPVGSVYPGVEVHANMIAGILDGSIKQQPAYVMAAELLLVLVFGLTLALLMPLLSPLRASLLALLALAIGTAIVLSLWQRGVVLPAASLLWSILGLYAFNMAWGFFVESKAKRQFTDLFGQYVPPELVDEMAKNPESYSMEGKKEELTVLFSDVRSFTTLSEGLDPKELAQLMNEYLGAMTDVIRDHRGTVDKYIGDAIMAFWGAPVANPQHAREATLTALAMQRAVRSLDEPFKQKGWPPLHIGVGVNTGIMTVGDMGSPVRKAYTVMGDAVNLGSRLEGITKQYGVEIIVGDGTKAQLTDFVLRELDRVRVKGKDEPVGIFEPIGLTSEVAKEKLDELKLWNQFMRLYRAQDWDQAELQLMNLTRLNPETKLYEIYAERIEHYRKNPPGTNWDGVTTFATK